MLKIAIDLLWVKHNNIGGVESYVRNLLDGIKESKEDFSIYLIVSMDNCESFVHYVSDERFSLVRCKINASNSFKAILWINFHLDRLISKLDVSFCFVPNSRKPFFTNRNNKYICTIHDLQALHYPEYFSKIRLAYLRFNWKMLIKSSYKLIAISQYVKNDIIKRYGIDEAKVSVIYNPISSLDDLVPFEEIAVKYGVEKYKYYYTVSSLLRHKNTLTLLKMMNVLVNEKNDSNVKLLISGIKGDHFNYLNEYINSHHLEENCLFTGFVSDAERNTLMKNCDYFLFPSIFEGFGMPVIEALRLGAKVITTRYTSIEEVSQGKAIYVENPFDEKEWFQKIEDNKSLERKPESFTEYNCDIIAQKYLDYFVSII